MENQTQITQQNQITSYIHACGDIPEGLRDDLIPVAIGAHGTTFVEDSDYVPDGIGLSKLERYKQDAQLRPHLTHCLRKLVEFTRSNWVLGMHLRDFGFDGLVRVAIAPAGAT